jgi:hypothetical protein
MQPKATIETVTPEIAAKYVALSDNIRQSDPRRVTRLATIIREGRWHLTNDSVAFDSKGRLVNGEHRLRACIEAGKPIVIGVLRGMDDAVCIDTGSPRSVMLVLRGMGGVDTAGMAAMARLAIHYEMGNMDLLASRTLSPADHEMIVNYVLAHPDMLDSLRIARKAHKVMQRSVLAFVHWKGKEDHPDKADAFVEALANGANLTPDNAALRLRERLLRARQERGHLTAYFLLQLTLRAWNRFVTNCPVENLVVRDNELEPFWKPGVTARWMEPTRVAKRLRIR